MNRVMAKPACVFLMKRNGVPYRWIVKTTVNRERIYLGCFKTKEDAMKAWNKYLEKNNGKRM